MARKQVSGYSRADVMHSLLMAKPALGKGNFVPVLGHFCFDGEHVTAYDDSIAIQVPLRTPFSCAVPGELMLKLLGTMVADDMDMEVVEHAVRVTCGRSTMKLPLLPDTAFLFSVDVLKRKRVLGALPVNGALVDGLTKCLLAVGNDPTHPAQMGVTVCWEKDNLFLYSTDNVTMSEFWFTSDAHPDGAGAFLSEGGAILPAEFCRQLVSLQSSIQAEGVLEFTAETVIAHFPSAEGVLLFGKLIVVEKPLDFPAVFHRMMPNEKSKHFNIPAGWDAVFMRAAAVVNPANPITTVSCEEGTITVESKSPMGETVDVMELEDVKVTCRPFNIDPQHIIRASKLCGLLMFQPKALVLQDAANSFTHLISHCVAE